jgi:hypothetical protein
MQGFPDRYWLLHLSSPMHDDSSLADFHYVLVMHTGHNLAKGCGFEDWSVPMFPVLRKVEPGEHVSFDGELLAGVKASIHRVGDDASSCGWLALFAAGLVAVAIGTVRLRRIAQRTQRQAVDRS